jgi:hypothetical protein
MLLLTLVLREHSCLLCLHIVLGHCSSRIYPIVYQKVHPQVCRSGMKLAIVKLGAITKDPQASYTRRAALHRGLKTQAIMGRL